MAKLKAHKRRRIRLRRVAVIGLVLLALIVAAVGAVTLRIRAIALSMLRKQLPNCEVTLGRAVLNPLSKLSLYDLRIADRSRPDADSTINLQHVVARYKIASGLKLDIDLDVSRPTVVLDLGGEMPFPDLFARKPEKKPSRLRLRACDVRDCRVLLDAPGLHLDATLDAKASGLGSDDAQHPADVSLQVRDLVVASRSVEHAEATTAAVRIGKLEAALAYDATQPEAVDRLLLHRVRVQDCAVAILYPDFELRSDVELALVNETGNLCGHPTKLTAELAGFLMQAGSLRTDDTFASNATVEGTLHVRLDEPAATMKGTLTLGAIHGSLDGTLDSSGLRVETVCSRQPARALVDLFEREDPHKIPILHDFEPLTGTVDRFQLVLSHTPKRGLGLVGEIAAADLEGESAALGLTVKGMAVSTPFSLLPPEEGGPLELIVGDPRARLKPGRIVAREVVWKKSYPILEPTGTLASQQNNWYLTDILGTLFEGRGTGSIQALADGTMTLDVQFESVNLEPLFKTIGREGDQMTGRADGTLVITMASTPHGTAVQSFTGVLRTKAPGGLIRFKEKEASFDALPGGDQVLSALKQRLPGRDFDHFLNKFKNYQYESVTIDARKSGDEYVLEVKVRDADKRNPLPLDLTIRYSRTHVYHDGPPSDEKGTHE